MTIFAFFLGLALGIGFWLWKQNQLHKQLEQILELLPSGIDTLSLPLVYRLLRGISLTNQRCLEIEAESQIWKHLLQKATVGYLQVDEENQVLWCNQQAQQLLQISRWEPGQVRLLLELVRSYELDQLIEQTRDQQQPGQLEWEFHPAYADVAAMEGVRSLTLRAHSWHLPHGQVGVFLENQQPLVELAQRRDRWVSDLAHELRTPLTSIRLVAEALQNRLQPPLSRWVDQLLPETDRLINLVQDWLELSQMEGDLSKNLTRKPVELRTFVQSVWQTLEPLARQKQLSLTYSGADVCLPADPSRLTQVFLNIFDNSIKYSPEQGNISVEVNLFPQTDRPDSVQINIIDSGCGFPESDLPHVFERLYRGDPSRTRQEKFSSAENGWQASCPDDIPPQGEPPHKPVSRGSGLGLAIVRQIVLAHRGCIQAKNHPKTGGAWLQIQLPKNWV